MTNLDITSYNIGELLQFADIYNKRIEDVSEDEIKKGIDARIIRSMQLNKPKITEFFQAVREKLLESLDLARVNSPKEKKEEIKNIENKHDDGWSKAYHLILDSKKDTKERSKLRDPENYMPGDVNPVFKSKIKRHLIVINSHNRKIATNFYNKDNITDVSGTYASKHCLSKDEMYKIYEQPKKMYVEPESCFTFTLSSALKDIVKLSIKQIEIPISWYVFTRKNSTTSFKIGPSTDNGVLYYPIDVANAQQINIDEGNYTDEELVEEVQAKLSGYTIAYNKKTRKVTISATAQFNLFFYLEHLEERMIGDLVVPAVEGMIVDDDGIEVHKPKLDYHLGWLLGFRKARYMGQMSYTAEAQVDTYGTRTITLEIDDFNKSSVTDNIVTIREEGDLFGSAKKPEDCFAPQIENIKNLDQGLNFGLCRAPKDAELPEKDTEGNKRKQITKQMWWAQQQLKALWKPMQNRTRPAVVDNCFARIQVKKGDGPIIFENPDLGTSEKKYFGPVTISRIKVCLRDERGVMLDLNGTQWSVQIEAETT